MTKAVVVLSGGQDSATCLFWAKKKFDKVEAVSFFYGQRHQAELEAAAEIAAMAEIPHHVFDLSVLSKLSTAALVDPATEVAASGGMVDSEAPNGLPTTFVPFRNSMFLTVAAAHAIRIGAKNLVTGVCQTDYSGYPDCREKFLAAQVAALNAAMPSGAGRLRIYAPLMDKTKAETVKLGFQLGPECWAAIAKTVTCYHGLRPGCGKCPACELRAKGFAEANEIDPALGDNADG